MARTVRYPELDEARIEARQREGLVMTDTILRATPRPGVLHLTLNRPEKRNALNVEMLGALAASLEAARADDNVRCVVLSGDARAFCAGTDITEMVESGLAVLESEARDGAWKTIEGFPKPLVAAVVGFAYGGGHELAMLCDIVIAGENARFGQPEISIGILPGDGATQRIPRSVGKSMAMKLILSGEPIDAATALAAGLVAEVAPHEAALERALDLAAKIAEKSPVALQLAKQAVLAAYETGLSEGLKEERRILTRAFATEDREEGMKAFLEKRPPNWKGR
jgi:enoyl-CoA hydratase